MVLSFPCPAVRAVPDGYLMTPPYLSGYAPVSYIFHPGVIAVCPALGDNLNPFVPYGLYCVFSKPLDIYVPLHC